MRRHHGCNAHLRQILVHGICGLRLAQSLLSGLLHSVLQVIIHLFGHGIVFDRISILIYKHDLTVSLLRNGLALIGRCGIICRHSIIHINIQDVGGSILYGILRCDGLCLLRGRRHLGHRCIRGSCHRVLLLGCLCLAFIFLLEKRIASLTARHQLIALALQSLLRFSFGSCLCLCLCGQTLQLGLRNGGSCRLGDLLILAVILRIIQNSGTAIRHALGCFCRLRASLLLCLLELLRMLLLFCAAELLLLGNHLCCLFRLGHALGHVVQAIRNCRTTALVCRLEHGCVFVFCHCKFPQLIKSIVCKIL